MSEEGRRGRLGQPLECPWCDSEEGDDALGEGGDPACFAESVCPECGAVRGDGTGHRPGCSSAADARPESLE